MRRLLSGQAAVMAMRSRTRTAILPRSGVTARPCGWRARSASRFATSWRRCTTVRFWSSPIAWIGSSRGARSSGSPGSSSQPIRAWCRRTTSSSSIRLAVPIPRRGISGSSIHQSDAVQPICTKRARRTSRAASRALKDWIGRVPADEPIAVAFSGGIDSTATLLLARHACTELGRHPDQIRAFTLDFGGGEDAAQAERAARAAWTRVELGASRGQPERVRSRGRHPSHRGLSTARCRMCGDVALSAARSSPPASTSEISARRRRRRRESQVVSARGLRPDAVQRVAQPALVPGGLGRGRDQAQPRVLGRACRAATCARSRLPPRSASMPSRPSRSDRSSPPPSRFHSSRYSTGTPSVCRRSSVTSSAPASRR